jgi:TonB family protein
VGRLKTSWSNRCMRQDWGKLCFIGLIFISISISISTAPLQSQNAPSPRKLVYKVAPKYPPELKQNSIGGVVRLSVSISANGSVGRISPIGGNPILVDAATSAVKQWKYVTADRPTTTEVQVDFIPNESSH